MSAPRSPTQTLVYGCLILSGSTSLVYELLWTRILSFSFGSTSLAFAAVLAVFFLGLAVGSLLGGRAARRLSNPLRAYGWLELAIGAYAGLAFPFLFKLHHLFSLHNAGGAEPSGLAFRFAAAAAVLAFPTLCMGATFPVLLEHLHRERSHLSEALGRLYGVNTLGAFLGVYLATHWLIPVLGLDKANYAAVAVNILVFALVLLLGGRPVPADAASAVRADAPVSGPGPAPEPAAAGASPRLAFIGLMLLAASGFTTLGYEVVWSRVLTISMDGSLYGIGTTLGSFLAGIGLGGVAFSFLARRLHRPESLFRAYVLVCLAAIGYLALSRLLLPLEGYLIKSVNQSLRGLLGLHLNFGIAVLFLLPVTTALGFMFPAAVALYNQGRANPAEGAGRAYALNTVMSVLGSLLSASLLMDRLGIEGIVFLGALVMLGTLLVAVLLAEAGKPDRRIWLALVALPLLLVAGWWPAVDAKTVLLGTTDGKPPSLSQAFQNLAVQFSSQKALKVYKDGVGTTLTVFLNGRTVSLLSNGLPQSGRNMDPPYFNLESTLVGLLPALHKPEARDALVVGLGAGISVSVLRMAGVPSVEVVELEPSMADICRGIYPKGKSPLDDTGVTLRLDDARNFLVRNGYRKQPRRWDLIASQPAHPWVTGAADLFTEEMFRLAYANLSEGGVFCQWFMSTGIDAEAYAALANAFGRVFDRVLVYRTFGSLNGLYFIGTRGASELSLAGAEEVFARPGLRQLLELHNHRRPHDVFKYAVMGLSPGSALLSGEGPVNRDRNAFVESRMPLLPKHSSFPLEGLPGSGFSGPLPAGFREAGARETLFVFRAIDELSGNLPAPQPPAESDSIRIVRMRAYRTHAPSPFREYYDAHLSLAAGMPAERLDSAAVLARAAGRPLLEAQLRFLRLRMGPSGFADGRAMTALPDSLPAGFLVEYRSRQAAAAAEAAAAPGSRLSFRVVDSLAALPGVDSLHRGVAALLKAHRLGDAAAGPDTGILRALYKKVLVDWPQQERTLAALEWYSEATGRQAWAQMAHRTRESRREESVKQLTDNGLRWKKAGKPKEALLSFNKALELNPAHQNAYLGKAEIFGRMRDPSGYASLLADIHRVFPIPDAVLQRVQEAYELSPNAGLDSETLEN